MLFAAVVSVLVLAASSPADARPKAVLLGGFGWPLTSPIGELAPRLAAKGYAVQVCSHFCLLFRRDKIAVVVGHSLGGDAAVAYSRRAHPGTKVYTIDPTRMNWGCAPNVKCVNVHNSRHWQAGGAVRNARNIDCAVAFNGCGAVGHIPMARSKVVWSKLGL